jgi:hypothetical protein
MIAFGVSVTDGEAYRRYAEPGIDRVREADSEVYVFAAVGQVARSYNLLLDTAAKHRDLEALVLVHSFTELTTGDICGRIRETLADPDVAIIGPIGASRVQSMAWWEGQISAGPVMLAYQEHGGGAIPAYGWKERSAAGSEVDVVAGMLLVLSPWAVRNLRFDETLALGHGYDVDYCLQARAAGKKVMTADLPLTHYSSLELVDDLNCWVEAHIQLAEKWQGRFPGSEAGHEDPSDEEWKCRARRAEAKREVVRSIAYGSALMLDARVLAIARELRRTEHSVSWRITEPLRRANHWRKQHLTERNAPA